LIEPQRFPVDSRLFEQPNLELSQFLDFSIHSCRHLLNVLSRDSSLSDSKLYSRVHGALLTFSVDPADRKLEETKAATEIVGKHSQIGKALWFLDPSKDAQLLCELQRLAKEEEEDRGTYFLFYIAATLASQGFSITFVPERGKTQQKTPDLRAERNGKVVWIEATTKNIKNPVDTTKALQRHIFSAIEEKKHKFTSPEFSPGMIVFDVSGLPNYIGDSSIHRGIALHPSLLCPPNANPLTDEFWYPLFRDDGWRNEPANDNNVFRFLADAFASIDQTRFNVCQCLMAKVFLPDVGEDYIGFPKLHQLIVLQGREDLALTELAKHKYVIGSFPEQGGRDRPPSG
jgi:hypothetical protein